MYGHRARIGYTSPPYLTETFPYEFYKMVPAGVTLVLTTLAIKEITDEAVKRSVEMTLEAAGEMGRAGVDLVVFGGVPLNLSLGYDGLETTMRETEQKIGVPVTSSVTAQINALRRLEARKVALVHPFSDSAGFDPDYVRHYGFELCGIKGAGKQVGDLARISSDVPRQLARALYQDHPEADTLYFPAPHWGIIDIIDPLEKEFGVNVVTAIQAIVWESLRRCGLQDQIEGYGRLLRAF
jgi:maleate isomerase